MDPSADLKTIPQEGVFRDIYTHSSNQLSLYALSLGGKYRDDLNTDSILKLYIMVEIQF